VSLRRGHPCSTAFLDETGAISCDRFFGVGVLKTAEPAKFLRTVQKLRDQRHWYNEITFKRLNSQRKLDLYRELADRCLRLPLQFLCFIADRQEADPIARFGTPWDAYGKLAEQLVVASIRRPELVAIMADNYSTPSHILFEEDLRAAVNRRLHRLAVVSVVRLDSRSSDGLQVVDMLTAAIAHEFRASAGLASCTNWKAQLSAHVRGLLGTTTCLSGWRNLDHSIQVYDHGGWAPPGTPAIGPGIISDP
jgi:hypothetical protein